MRYEPRHQSVAAILLIAAPSRRAYAIYALFSRRYARAQFISLPENIFFFFAMSTMMDETSLYYADITFIYAIDYTDISSTDTRCFDARIRYRRLHGTFFFHVAAFSLILSHLLANAVDMPLPIAESMLSRHTDPYYFIYYATIFATYRHCFVCHDRASRLMLFCYHAASRHICFAQHRGCFAEYHCHAPTSRAMLLRTPLRRVIFFFW